MLKPGFIEGNGGGPGGYTRSSASSAVSNATGSSGTGGLGAMVSRYSHCYVFSLVKIDLIKECINALSSCRMLFSSFPPLSGHT